MFGIGTQELIIILVIALLILGPKQLPELAKTIGKGLTELRRAMDGVKDTVNPSKVFDRMMEEEEKKTTAKKETAKKDASDTNAAKETQKDTAKETPKDTSGATAGTGENAGKKTEKTAQSQDKKDTAETVEEKTTAGDDTELKG